MKFLRSIVCAAAIIGAGSLGQAQASGIVDFGNSPAGGLTPAKYVHSVSYDDCPPYYGSSYYHRPYRHYGHRHYYPYRRHYGYRPYYRRYNW